MLRHFVTLLGVVAFLALAAGPALAVDYRPYLITDVGTLGGTGQTKAWDINNAGQVTGESRNSDGMLRGFFWENGTITNAGTLSASGVAYFGRGIASDGTVLLREYISSSISYAGLWKGGTATYDMGPSCGSVTNVWGINDDKAIVGEEWNKRYAGYSITQSVLFMNGSFVDMGMSSAPLNYWSSCARAVSNDYVVGHGYRDPATCNWFPFRYDISAGTVTDLRTLIPNAATANGINAAGWIVGETFADGYDGYLYDNTTTTAIPRLPGNGRSVPNDVNINGQAVGGGYSSGTVSARAFLYDNDTATITALYDMLSPAAQAQWTNLGDAQAINDSGQIVGYGSTSDGVRGYVMTPTLSGDANIDGSVNGTDLNTVLSSYNATISGDNRTRWLAGDFNCDGSVNGTDLNTVLSNYNQSISFASAAVPEPSTLLLMALGLVGLLVWRKRTISTRRVV